MADTNVNEKILNTRIVLKNDDLATWNSSSIILKKGEIALAAVSSATNGNYEVPTYLMKVGDGVSTFANLKWVAAAAADVYDWAKKENPTIEELPANLKTAIKNLQSAVGEGGSVADSIAAAINALDVTDAAVEHQFVTAVSETDGKISVTRAALTAADIPALGIDKITGLQTALDAKLAIADFNTFKTTNSEAIADAKKAGTDAANALGTYKTTNDAAVKVNADAIAAIRDDANIDSFADVVAELAKKQNTGDYATKTEAQGYADAKDAAIKAAKDAADAAQADVNNLETYVGTLPEGATATDIVGYIQEKTAGIATEGAMTELGNRVTTVEGKVSTIEEDYLKGADKTELQGKIDEVSGKVTTLIGEDANKSVRTIANEELAAQLIGEDAKESLDTLEEIAAWIQSHPDSASAMNEAIVALQNQLKGIAAGEGTVKKYIDDAITALNVGQYALAADLTALAGRVATLEGTVGDSTKGLVKAVADNTKAITDGDAATLNSAKAYAKEYADGLAGNYDAAGSASTAETNAKAYAKEYADGLAKNYDAAGAADTALASAKTYTNEEIAKLDSNIAATAGHVLTGVTITDGKLTAKTEVGLAAIATTGSTDDLVQGSKTLVFDCGTSSTVL